MHIPWSILNTNVQQVIFTSVYKETTDNIEFFIVINLADFHSLTFSKKK